MTSKLEELKAAAAYADAYAADDAYAEAVYADAYAYAYAAYAGAGASASATYATAYAEAIVAELKLLQGDK